MFRKIINIISSDLFIRRRKFLINKSEKRIEKLELKLQNEKDYNDKLLQDTIRECHRHKDNLGREK